MKLVALYKEPEDRDQFKKKYFEGHIPLIEKVPGLVGTEFTYIRAALQGETYYMMAVLTFADKESFKKGLNSPEMAAAGEYLDSFAKDQYTLFFGSDLE
jgi:uncharacterized protein (TIGR02118 family)